ncbi:hypothetical protein Shyhy01_64700 [Streptomyces hygroscopicus subsp. hygroscopicus]|nr:hypothetical protein Shyhy01_64700 [Streptomyces hygroscopicus subsp. hygroscopicus]
MTHGPSLPRAHGSGGFSGVRGVFERGARGSDPFTAPYKGTADALAGRRKVGESSKGTSEGGTG